MPPEDFDLGVILLQSQHNNTIMGITGVLFYADGNVLQVLEGEADAVERLFATIRKDPRHRNVIVLLRLPIAERQFPNWLMALRTLRDLPPEHQAEQISTLREWQSQPARSTVTREVEILLQTFLRTLR
jgi:hypothetical protein